MVGHQTQGIDLHPVVGFPGLEGIEVIEVVGVLGKDDLTIVSALDDMMRVMGHDQAGVSRHTGLPGRQRANSIGGAETTIRFVINMLPHIDGH